jgi:hypothetical protein
MVLLHGQVKTVTVRTVDRDENTGKATAVTYTLTTNGEGIINSETCEGDPRYFNRDITLRGNSLTMRLYDNSIDTIRWEGNAVYSQSQRNYERDTETRVNPSPGVIYENKLITLFKRSETVLEEISAAGSAVKAVTHTYNQNTLFHEYLDKDNIQFKYEFRKTDQGIAVTPFHIPAGGYSAGGDIVITGDNLRHNNMVINVINYFILTKLEMLSEYFFPSLFLDDPFIDRDRINNKYGLSTHYSGVGIQSGDIIFDGDYMGLYFIYEDFTFYKNYYKINGRYKYSIREEPNGIKIVSFGDNSAVILYTRDILCFLYKDYTYAGISHRGQRDENNFSWMWSADKLNASSFLTEGQKKYEAKNLITGKLDNPWAEGVRGPGIGEYIEAEWYSEISGAVFINGYISESRPDLYNANNRIKRMKICPDGSGTGQEIVLEDSPDPQLVNFNFGAKKLRFEILEVYKGDRYDDTCLSMLIGVGRWVSGD